MHDSSDMDLLREYARQNSEAAFAGLVRRHIALVYSAALRHVGSAGHAEEITQAVFIILARKAAGLRPDTILPGWLCETTRLTALSFLRGERRRQFREQEAYMQSTLQESNETAAWHQLAPLLDEALARLGKKERDAVVLRFFKDQNLREVAAALNINEPAAQRRVHRAVEKLRQFFMKRGIAFSSGTITGAISANSVQAVPVGLVKTVTLVAMTKGVAASGSTLTLIKGALKIMAWTKMKMAVVVGVGVLLAAGTTTVTIKEIQEHRTYPWQEFPGDGGMLDHQPPQVKILSSKYSKFGTCSRNGKILEIGATVRDILAAAYGVASAHVSFATRMPLGEYDFIANLPQENEAALRYEIKKRFGLIGKMEVRDSDVLLLKVSNVAKLRSHAVQPHQTDFTGPGGLQYDDPLAGIAAGIELIFQKPVIDASGQTNAFHLRFLTNETDWNSMQARIESVRQTLVDELDQVGLELVSTNMPIEMMVVEKVK